MSSYTSILRPLCVWQTSFRAGVNPISPMCGSRGDGPSLTYSATSIYLKSLWTLKLNPLHTSHKGCLGQIVYLQEDIFFFYAKVHFKLSMFIAILVQCSKQKWNKNPNITYEYHISTHQLPDKYGQYGGDIGHDQFSSSWPVLMVLTPVWQITQSGPIDHWSLLYPYNTGPQITTWPAWVR